MHSTEYSKSLDLNIVGLYRLSSIPVFRWISARNMKIVPVYGLDFSQANLTFDDDIWLHRTKEDKPKVYLKLLNKFTKAIAPLSAGYCFPYAFGWKAITGSTTSDWLALSGDYFSPQVHFEYLAQRYLKTVNKIEFALPPNHWAIFNKVEAFSKIAMKEDLRRFLVHLHITPGLIEDYQELIKTIINQANKENGKFCLF